MENRQKKNPPWQHNLVKYLLQKEMEATLGDSLSLIKRLFFLSVHNFFTFCAFSGSSSSMLREAFWLMSTQDEQEKCSWFGMPFVIIKLSFILSSSIHTFVSLEFPHFCSPFIFVMEGQQWVYLVVNKSWGFVYFQPWSMCTKSVRSLFGGFFQRWPFLSYSGLADSFPQALIRQSDTQQVEFNLFSIIYEKNTSSHHSKWKLVLYSGDMSSHLTNKNKQQYSRSQTHEKDCSLN